MGWFSVEILTTPEPCESCGSNVAVTRHAESGNTRLSNISSDGRVLPGPHDGDECRMRR